LLRLPYITAARFPQEKVFQDGLPLTGGERSVADLARYFQIDGLGDRLSFDDLVKRFRPGECISGARGRS
jgi:hypothetical protein